MYERIVRIERMLEEIHRALLGDAEETSGESANAASRERPHSTSILATFTTKQHAVLQMLLASASNDEIAERFGVSPNTAKVYVRTIAKKCGVNTRAQIVMQTLEDFNSLSEHSYMLVTGGLPKTWHEDYSEPDPFAHMLRKKGESELNA